MFFRRLVGDFDEPRVVITDKLSGYIKPIEALAPGADHRSKKGISVVSVFDARSFSNRLRW